MTELEQCTEQESNGNTRTITCKKGLWEVTGTSGVQLMKEAHHYFNQYKSDGEYSDIIGGPAVSEVIQGVYR